MMFLSFNEVKNLLQMQEGSIEVECMESPQVKMNAVVGVWHVFFAPNDGSARIPLITSGTNPKIRVLKRLHGIFVLLHSLEISTILIPTVVGETVNMARSVTKNTK